MAWDPTRPPNNGDPLSPEIRQMWDAIGRSMFGVNLCKDPAFLIWPVGDSVNAGGVSGHWQIAGTSAVLSREGTIRKIVKGYAGKVVAGGGAVGKVFQSAIPAADIDDFFDNWYFALGAWVYATAATTARLRLDDGNGSPSFSSYHAGNSAWAWLTVSRTIAAAATKIEFGMDVEASGTGYLQGATLGLGEVVPANYMPAPIIPFNFMLSLPGSQSVVADANRFRFGRPAIVRGVQLGCQTAPTGADFIIDVNHWDGSAFQSMYSTRPKIVATNKVGAVAAPDGATYRYRCFRGFGLAASDADVKLGIDVDQVGSTIAGSDVQVYVRGIQYASPLEAWLGDGDEA